MQEKCEKKVEGPTENTAGEEFHCEKAKCS